MANYALFKWAAKRLKRDDNGVYFPKCRRNDFLIWLMDLSGVEFYMYYDESKKKEK